MSNIKNKFIKDQKVRIKGQKQILTITGEKLWERNVMYWQVKEREYYIPEEQLQLIN